MEQSGNEGAPSSDRQYENSPNHVALNGVADAQNSIISALPPPMPSRKLGEQPPVVNNVELVITKAKKAATYLYTLLHAKNCRLSADRCLHPGCAEAKLMYLHLKTCGAEGISCCSTEYKGCVDARKLLLHYRRCRDIRSRKASGQGSSEPHFCLVCSLVARNAKSKGRSLSPNSTNAPKQPRKQLMPSAGVRCTPVSQPQKQQLYKQELRVRPRSFSFSDIGRSSIKPTVPRELVKTMPPPPPRFSVPSLPGRASNAVPGGFQKTMSSALAVTRSPEHRDQLSNNARPRAESLDLRRARFLEPPASNEEPLNHQPTVGKVRFHVRRRSASFDALSSSVKANEFPTIEEEPVGEDLQEMLEGDR
ncbi:unnamed protein product [Cylindrotheca closterium]|uniref:TAZ-type domain-containing protein n=1 Tax=Cylindrotheca closterium TaxID=2856 RepID=A0AAD2CGW8_9STRA|nr:unnamed protein product [Cylindrotheca closterium]